MNNPLLKPIIDWYSDNTMNKRILVMNIDCSPFKVEMIWQWWETLKNWLFPEPACPYFYESQA